MNIETSFATQLYQSAGKLAAPAAEADPGADFAAALAEAARGVAGELGQAEATAEAALRGTGDIQSVAEALTATELALQTAVAVRDRVVEAYQEVLRMPV